MPVKKGDKIKIEYEGTLDDGSVFDSSEKHGKPLEFEAGSGKVIKGFDEAVIGMEVGEEKKVHITKDKAYGDRKEELVKKAPKEQFPKDKKVEPGMMLAVGLPNGAQLPAVVTDVKENEVTIDMNHPLAGKDLNFKIKVVEIEQ